MPTPTKGPRFGGTPAHERLILANMAQALFEHGRITTTQAKAKRLRPYAERLITKAKRGDLHNRREAQKVIRNKDVLHKLFAEIGPFYSDRNGGYVRIVKTLPRKGDNAPMAVIELINEKTATAEAEAARRSRPAKQEAPKSEAPAESPAEETTEAEAITEEETAEAGTTEEATEAAATPEAETGETETGETETKDQS